MSKGCQCFCSASEHQSGRTTQDIPCLLDCSIISLVFPVLSTACRSMSWWLVPVRRTQQKMTDTKSCQSWTTQKSMDGCTDCFCICSDLPNFRARSMQPSDSKFQSSCSQPSRHVSLRSHSSAADIGLHCCQENNCVGTESCRRSARYSFHSHRPRRTSIWLSDRARCLDPLWLLGSTACPLQRYQWSALSLAYLHIKATVFRGELEVGWCKGNQFWTQFLFILDHVQQHLVYRLQFVSRFVVLDELDEMLTEFQFVCSS